MECKKSLNCVRRKTAYKNMKVWSPRAGHPWMVGPQGASLQMVSAAPSQTNCP